MDKTEELIRFILAHIYDYGFTHAKGDNMGNRKNEIESATKELYKLIKKD